MTTATSTRIPDYKQIQTWQGWSKDKGHNATPGLWAWFQGVTKMLTEDEYDEIYHDFLGG